MTAVMLQTKYALKYARLHKMFKKNYLQLKSILNFTEKLEKITFKTPVTEIERALSKLFWYMRKPRVIVLSQCSTILSERI